MSSSRIRPAPTKGSPKKIHENLKAEKLNLTINELEQAISQWEGIEKSPTDATTTPTTAETLKSRAPTENPAVRRTRALLLKVKRQLDRLD